MVIMRGALDHKVRTVRRFYHVPASNTAVGHSILENDAYMKIILAGAGAFGSKHLEAIAAIGGIEVVSLVGRDLAATPEVAKKWQSHTHHRLAESAGPARREAAILATPTQLHAPQAMECLRAGKHVHGRDSARRLAGPMPKRVVQRAARDRPGLHGGHTRRFNPSAISGSTSASHAGELNILQMDVQTYFFRRTNMNALGQAAQLDRPPALAPRRPYGGPVQLPDRRRPRMPRAQGPIGPTLGIAMDMSIRLKAPSGAICTLSLSFNNDGPLGTFFRYICDNGTYIARYDDLSTARTARSTCPRSMCR